MSKDVKRMSLEQAESFISDQVTSAIKSCRSSRAYGPGTLSIFHLKSLGPLATEHLTALHTDSLKLLLLYALFNHPRLLIQVARVQKAQFSYRLDGLVP